MARHDASRQAAGPTEQRHGVGATAIEVWSSMAAQVRYIIVFCEVICCNRRVSSFSGEGKNERTFVPFQEAK